MRAVRWLLALAAAFAAMPALAQSESSPAQLAGTLRKARDSGSITLAYRASSIPFSYLSPRGEPIGYSVDLCKLLVDAIGLNNKFTRTAEGATVHMAGAGLIPCFQGINSLFGLKLPHMLRDPVL